MANEIEFTLADFQDDFIASDTKRVAIIAAKGGGKTWSGARFLVRQAITQPREQHLFMMNTLGQAKDVYYQDIQPLLEDLKWPYHFSPQSGNLKIFDTTFHIRSAESDSIKRIESIQYGSGWADETSFYDYESFKVFVSRVRTGQKLLRVTSMPDEPDHWMYTSLSKAGFLMHEKSLYDNPDKEFVKDYEEILKAFYEGPQLRRYLSGERVSLAGLGLFNIHADLKGSFPYDKDEDLFLFWDFNVAYRAVSAWQKVGTDQKGRPQVACVNSWQMKEHTVHDDAIWLAKHFCEHGAKIILGGDASENKRSSQTTESIWQTVRRAFRETYEQMEDEDKSYIAPQIRSVVPAKNPNVKDTIQCCNWCFGQNVVFFDEHEKNVYNSLASAKADKYGEIDKSADDKPGGAKSHESDTARYFIFHIFRHIYPGGKKNLWAI